MYSWGSDLYGQLGHGSGSSTKSRAESSEVRSTPRVWSWHVCLAGPSVKRQAPTFELLHCTDELTVRLRLILQDELPSSSLGPEDSMLSTPLNFDEGKRTIGKVTRVNFEQSMRNLHSPLRMPRGKVGPKIETDRRRRRPEPKMKGAPVRKRNEELENEVNAFIAGVAHRLNKSAMLYSPPRFDSISLV